MSYPNTPQTDAGNGAAAVAAPPAPPAQPPLSGTGTPGREPGRVPRGAIVAVVVALIALLLLGVVVWLVFAARGGSGGHARAGSLAVQTPFASAMQKAGVKASYPAKAPVSLTGVVATGSHQFTATFTPDEIAALIDTFSYTADVAGMQISMSNATMTFPSPGTVHLAANVTANGGSYSGELTAPVTYSAGEIRSSGVTELSVEGISANAAQKGQVSDALVLYANSLLSAAPGLTIESASIEGDGLHVSGVAPDSLAYP